MFSHVTLLRGINVNGIQIKMADLKKAFIGMGLSNVTTVLATGNVLFSSAAPEPSAALKQRLDQGLSKTFGYEAHVVLLSIDQVNAIIAAYPFDEQNEAKQPYVVLASDDASLPELAQVSSRLDPGEERIELLGERVLYWEVTRGRSTESRFAKELARTRYKATTTTRNLRTLRKVVASANGA